MDNEELEKAKFFFDLTLKSEQVIQQANERLTEKIRSSFALASTLIPIVVGLGYFILKETDTFWIFWFIFPSLIAYIYAIARGIFLHMPSGYKFVNPMKAIDKHKEKSLRFIIGRSSYGWSRSVDHNKRLINSKERGLKHMLTSIAIGLLILIISFLALGISMLN